MTVSFVNAGLLTLGQAISVIMGANIGTTVTAWIMSIFGFQIDMNNLIFPLFALAVPLIFYYLLQGMGIFFHFIILVDRWNNNNVRTVFCCGYGHYIDSLFQWCA